MSETQTLPTEPATRQRNIQVLTHENAEAFYNEKLAPKPGLVYGADVAEEAPQEAAKDEPKREAKTEPADDEHEEIKEARRKSPKLEERFSELTGKRKAAEKAALEANEKAASERKAREDVERQLKELRDKYEPPKTEIGPKPDAKDFEDLDSYSSAIEKWALEKAEFESAKKASENKEKERKASVQKTWVQRQTAFIESHPDYSDKLGASSVEVAQFVHDAIVESEVGPAILYHLAENPDVADTWRDMTPASALRALGKLEAKLETEAARAQKKEEREAKKDEPKVEAKAEKTVEISKAPAPISPLKGTGTGISAPVDSEGNYKGDYATYKQLRQQGKIK